MLGAWHARLYAISRLIIAYELMSKLAVVWVVHSGGGKDHLNLNF